MPFIIIPPSEPPICDICGKAVHEWWFGEDPIRHERCWSLWFQRRSDERMDKLREQLGLPNGVRT